MKYSELDETISSHRELADWLDNNRDRAIELPSFYMRFNTYVHEYAKNEYGGKDYTKVDDNATRNKMRRIAKALGSAEKTYSGDNFFLKKKFGTITLVYQTTREAICRKVVKESREVPAQLIPAQLIEAHTEEVVEWVCDEPLLSSS